ncbi:MAG TPA: aminodeoxychorismate/anthranilate synthase component II [Actinomycetota bacterium]|jgi:anthranilate synthase/aminodeoxychorismate synthase-like glutamine amidotransferase|nr:aminodeoxychorismate/anthranilate synthase component II [Actinomycetota bacterium]
MRVLLIDNFDSFTFNLAQYLGSLGAEPVVVRNDATVDDLVALNTDAVVISPGPGHPRDAGCCVDAIHAFAALRLPLLGVCLGHQAIGLAFGGDVVRAEALMHGKTSEIHHDSQGVFAGLDDPFTATRYHSLVIKPETLPACLEVTARTADHVIMGVRHRQLSIEGVQFHPESIMTPAGMRLLSNFLSGAPAPA